MKKVLFYTLGMIIFLLSCKSSNEPDNQKVHFGIYQTLDIETIKQSVAERFDPSDIRMEENLHQPILAYTDKQEAMSFPVELPESQARLLRTIYPVDEENHAYAIVALAQSSELDNKDIERTKVKEGNIVIYFNKQGAKKWAQTTRMNTGRELAFVVNDQIYSLPYITGEIKNGTALLGGINEDALAQKISEALNGNISK